LPFELLTGAQTEDIYLKIYNIKLHVNSCGIGSKGSLLFERDRQFEKGEYGAVFNVLGMQYKIHHVRSSVVRALNRVYYVRVIRNAENKTKNPERDGALKADHLSPGISVSVNHFELRQRRRTCDSYGKASSQQYKGGCIFCGLCIFIICTC
jgi:hypothetical protein